ncbi:hypothetical protein [Nocardia brasiliensis]|uniref:hypothetical protein n=1 Tax=Nocardia brasiliensis TaxID=37326 RepID=UPI002455629C|nr:hypothetical protein [Nocardia brasiliensis]
MIFTPGIGPLSERPAPVPAVAVVIETSAPITTGTRRLTTVADFGYGLRYSLMQGRNHLMVPKGQYRVALFSQYAWQRVGQAWIDIDAGHGPITFYYASPYTIYSVGAAGFEPQKRPGRGAVLAIVGAAVLIPLLLVGIGLLLTR